MVGLAELSMAYGLSEIGLALVARAQRRGARAADRGTLGLVWLVIAGAGTASIWIANHVALGRFDRTPGLGWAACTAFVLGLCLRWWAIAVLGRFFTVDVAIHAGHELVQRGPYRLLRHPSYTGALLAFLGLGVLFQNGIALLVLLVPVLAVMLWRIRVEEAVLAAHFGERWQAHCRRTWRLVPFVW